MQQQSRQLVTSPGVPEQSARAADKSERPFAKYHSKLERMARGGDAAACRSSLALPPRFLLVLVATLTLVLVAPARAAWVEDYPSGVPCGVTIPVEQCDPGDAAANSTCRDVCHYGGARRGWQCVSLGLGRGRGCHCKC